MTRSKRYSKTALPEQIETPQQRGQTLRAWLEAQEIGVGDFALNSGIGRATLNRYLNGTKDLATVEQQIADRILRAMGISDGEAWELLNIPEEARYTFRSFRPPPLGHGAVVQALTDVRLEEALFGSVALPAGTIIRISKDGPTLEHVIVRLEDGRLFATNAGANVNGEVLGGLASAHFAIFGQEPQLSEDH